MSGPADQRTVARIEADRVKGLCAKHPRMEYVRIPRDKALALAAIVLEVTKGTEP